VLRRRGADIPVFRDAAAPALLVAQAIGRAGNYFNQELFGAPTTLPWALQIEWLGHRGRVRAPGLFALDVTGYSIGRIGEELLRIDPAHHILGLRLNLFVAAAVTITGAVWFIRTQRPGRDWTRTARRGGALLATGGPICLTGCGHNQTGQVLSHTATLVQARSAPSEANDTSHALEGRRTCPRSPRCSTRLPLRQSGRGA
jgi:hypothetical protein